MDKKKLIGTIIGIIMFAMLIVGATFAWLTFSATVTNATVNGVTLSYTVDYGKGEDISDIPMLGVGTKTTAAKVTVTAKRPEGSIADNIKLYLTSTSTGLTTTSGIVKYVVCVENDTNYQCDENFTDRTIQSVTEASTVEIYSGVLEAPEEDPETGEEITNEVTYDIYFWIDSGMLSNGHLTEGNNQYSGYIHADSNQDRSEVYK